MRLSRIGFLVLSAVGLVVWPGGSGTGNDRGYEVLRDDLEPFRSAFDAAADDVRAVLLVGPT